MNSQSISRLALIASSALSLTFAANPAFAQTAEAGASDNGGLADIVVTAQRKSESLIDVPVAVTAVDSAVLQRSNITSLESAAAIVPFVTIARVGSGNGGFMSIRGIASTPQDAGAQQSVLTNIDYVLIGRGRLATMAMFDVGQVEVLKGPQALYYGKNTTAGVFSMTSNDPGRNFGGYVKAGYEFEAHQRSVDAAVDYPLNDTLRMRVAGHYSKMRGYTYNAAVATPYPVGSAYQPWINAGATVAPGASNPWGPADEEVGGRVTMVYEPTSELTAKLKYTYARTTAHGTGGTALYQPYCVGNTTLATFGVNDPYSDCNRDFRISAGDWPSILASKTPMLRDGVPYAFANGHLASLNIDYQVADNLKLSAITGYYNVVYQGTGNFSPTVWAGIFTGTRDGAWGLSQELRLASSYDGPVNFEIGAFLDKLHQYTFGAAAVAPTPADPATGQFITYSRFTDSTSRSYSAFGKVNWEIVKNLTLSGGVRFTRYLLNSTDGNAFVNASAVPILAASRLVLRPQGDYFVRTYKDRNYSPEVILNWRPADRQLLYVSFKTGYKSGGFSYPSVLNTSYNDLPTGSPGSTRFAPEEANSWEVGYKAELFDRKLRVELAAYHTVVTNQQLSSFDSGTFSFIVKNAGKSRVQGVELQLTAAPAEGLQVFGSVGYNDGKYISFPGAQCSQVQACPTGTTQNLSGRRLPRAPQWAGNFGASYDMPLGMGMKLSLNGLGTFSSAYYSIDSLDPNTIQKAYVKWDAGIAIGSEDDKWRLALQGRNLSNKYITVYSYDAARMRALSYVAVPQRGRQVSLEATYRF